MVDKQKTVTEDSQRNKIDIGFGDRLPKTLIQELRVEANLEKGHKLGVLISKALLVLRVDSHSLSEKLKICDFITHVNETKITKKNEFYDFFHKLKKSGGQFALMIQRPLWSTSTENLPKGYDKAPGYNYCIGLLILYPGSTLGMNIKSYNSKVFITSVEQNSMAGASCLIGDCVIAVDDCPITSTRDFTERVTKALRTHKISILTLERPIDADAINVVRMALMAEKTMLIDPRMALDASHIGEAESKRIKSGLVPAPGKSIYRARQNTSGNSNRHVNIQMNTQDLSIGADPFNPILMQRVPPKKGDMLIGQVNPAPAPAQKNQKRKEHHAGTSSKD